MACSTDYLVSLRAIQAEFIKQANPPLFWEYLFLCPRCSSGLGFYKAQKRWLKHAGDQAKHFKSSTSASSLWLLLASQARNETERPRFRAEYWTLQKTPCAVQRYAFFSWCQSLTTSQRQRGTEIAAWYCRIFHRWVQCQGGLWSQQMRGEYWKMFTKGKLGPYKCEHPRTLKVAFILPGKWGMTCMQAEITVKTMSARHLYMCNKAHGNNL